MFNKKEEKLRRYIMTILEMIIHKIFILGKEPQGIGLSQFKAQTKANAVKSANNHEEKQKEIKLSDLMRRNY